MSYSGEKIRYHGPLPLSALVGRVIDPVAQRRGFATADLIAAWPDIAGARFGACTRPEKIVWARGEANRDKPGVLTLKVEGPVAILVQHELAQILDRVNAFLGHAAVGHIRLVQGQVGASPSSASPEESDVMPSPETAARVAAATARVDDQRLRAALERLGSGVRERKQA
jgi:hypothetical protein